MNLHNQFIISLSLTHTSTKSFPMHKRNHDYNLESTEVRWKEIENDVKKKFKFKTNGH